MRVTDLLYRALQHKSLDIVSAMDVVPTTKTLLLTLREEGFDHLLAYVLTICPQHDIEIPDMEVLYKNVTDHSCLQKNSFTICQHYHFDIFNSAIDFQREESNFRFSDGAVELLVLNSALDSKDNCKSFKFEEFYWLAQKFYSEDFTGQEMHYLKCQLSIISLM